MGRGAGSCWSAKAALEARPAPGLELGGGGGEVLVLPDPGDSSTPRAYFILHMISSHKIIVSLCPVKPLVRGAKSQLPMQELLRAEGHGEVARPGIVTEGPGGHRQS